MISHDTLALQAKRSGERKGPIAKQWEGEGHLSFNLVSQAYDAVANLAHVMEYV